jgi:hypothetical protein
VLLAPGISEATCTGPASADVPNSRDGCWAQATWPHSLLFLADLEPGVAEQLVAAGVLHPRAFDAQQSQGLRVMHYDIQAAKLPLGPLPLRGSISGDVYMRQVPVRSPRPGDVLLHAPRGQVVFALSLSLVCPLYISVHICGHADLAKCLSSWGRGRMPISWF